jgi:hypothetical protein
MTSAAESAASIIAQRCPMKFTFARTDCPTGSANGTIRLVVEAAVSEYVAATSHAKGGARYAGHRTQAGIQKG